MSGLDDLVLSGIQQYKTLNPGYFASEIQLAFNDYPALLMVVLSVDQSLPSLDFSNCESFLLKHMELCSVMKTAYGSGSFLALVNHPLVRTLADGIDNSIPEPGLVVKNDGKRSLQAAFEEPYLGNLHRQFISTLDKYPVSNTGDPFIDPYNRSISVIQSSGMGKSRMVDEAANVVFTIPANLREDIPSTLKTYPPPDTHLRSYLDNHAQKSDRLLQAEYAILLKHTFDTVTSLVPKVVGDLRGSKLARAWADYLKSGESEEAVGDNRISFYKTIVDAARKDISKIFKEIADDRRQLDESTDLAKLLSEMNTSASRMLQVVSPDRSRAKNACFMYFDEAHNLTKHPKIIEGFRSRSPYDNLGTVLSRLRELPIFFIFLSTNTHLHCFAPAPSYHPSARASQGSFHIPPFTELSFDIFLELVLKELADSKQLLSLENMCSVKVMSAMGRPLWFVHNKQWERRDEPGQLSPVSHVVKLAVTKLVVRGTVEHMHMSQFATLSARIGITFEPTTQASREAESRQVESHMRVVYAIPQHGEYMRTGSPSEPLLAEAAANHLNSAVPGGIAKAGPGILLHSFKNGFLAQGERGELCGRLLMTIAHDIAVIETYRQIEPLLSDPEVRFHRPVPVLAFLRALFATTHHETVLQATPMTSKPGEPTLEHRFKDAFIFFSHFAIAEDSDMLGAESLQFALMRGMALQTKENQFSIDAVIPIHMGPVTSAITTETTSAINLQFKNRKQSLECYVDRRITVPNLDQAVISIVFELGEEQANDPLVEVHHSDPIPTQHSQPHYHRDDNHYSFVAHGCSSKTYHAVHEEAENAYKAILASHSLKEDFPRAEDEDAWSQLQGLKPTFSSARTRATLERARPKGNLSAR